MVKDPEAESWPLHVLRTKNLVGYCSFLRPLQDTHNLIPFFLGLFFHLYLSINPLENFPSAQETNCAP